MIGAVTADLPVDIFPDDPWALVQTDWIAHLNPLTETLFALSNGNLGIRGHLSEVDPSQTRGGYLNGFYESWPISHPEFAYGLARTGQTIVNVPDATEVAVEVEGEVLHPWQAESYRRHLDFREGILEEHGLYRTPSGAKVEIRRKRVVSLSRADTLGMWLQVTTDRPLEVRIVSTLIDRQHLSDDRDDDPRRAAHLLHRVLIPRGSQISGRRSVRTFQTAGSGLPLVVGVDHAVTTGFAMEGPSVIRGDVAPGQPLEMTKWAVYGCGQDADDLETRVTASLDELMASSFDAVASSQGELLEAFWHDADIEVDAGPQIQRAIRWTLFQLRQASAQLNGRSIPAKGLTGQAYDGHYFWDTEIYVLPFLASADPKAAASLLHYRHSILPAARRRASELSQLGALYPWRTISGEEASAYYPAGTAQYHINADIVYALRHYERTTGDVRLVFEIGVEIAVETARMWEDLGFYRKELFHIHGVTGPDEYTAVVDDNAYTNAMARMNLRYAVDLVERLRLTDPGGYADLSDRLELTDDEPDRWSRAADAMFIPHDPQLGITPQDAQFLDKEPWDFAGTPASNYPLLLHYHPLVIYRFQVLKQADVLLADYLLSDEFDFDTRRNNYDFYNPITTGDSSLSACIHSIVASDVGRTQDALGHFHDALFVDLGDRAGNAADGVHMASAGGVWLALVAGFGGMRVADDGISFKPVLPPGWTQMTFRVQHRGVLLTVATRQSEVTITAGGGTAGVSLYGQSIVLHDGESATVPTEGG